MFITKKKHNRLMEELATKIIDDLKTGSPFIQAMKEEYGVLWLAIEQFPKGTSFMVLDNLNISRLKSKFTPPSSKGLN